MPGLESVVFFLSPTWLLTCGIAGLILQELAGFFVLFFFRGRLKFGFFRKVSYTYVYVYIERASGERERGRERCSYSKNNIAILLWAEQNKSLSQGQPVPLFFLAMY